jgi:hypothetical protein
VSDDTPRIEVTIAAPVDDVWRALREPAQIRHWHGWDDPNLEAEIQLIYLDEDKIAVSEADRTLEVQGGDRFELTDLGDRTRVRLTRAPRGSNPEWDAYYDDITEGWTTFVHQLRFALERHPGEPRRTLFFSGTLREGTAPITDLKPADAPSPITGAEWFRSDHQVGHTVEEWGDGLLVVGDAPPSPTKPDGGAMAVLSTYGLDEAAFDALQSSWTAWWEERFEPEQQPGTKID